MRARKLSARPSGRELGLAWLAVMSLVLGCATSRGARQFPRLDELEQCHPIECEHHFLKMERWSDSTYARGRLPYVTEPGNRLDGPPRRSVRRVIVAIHGRYGGDGQFTAVKAPPGLFYFRGVFAAFRAARQQDPSLRRDEIAIIAPTFQRSDEWEPYSEKDRRYWIWSRMDWLWSASASDREAERLIRRADPVAAFDVLDEILRQSTVKFPNVEQIVVVGHSAGGQAVQRYALLGTGVTERLERSGVHVRFVPANPGSYAFFMHERLLPAGRSSVPQGSGDAQTEDWQWQTPRGCEDYDDYRFGLARLDRVPRAVQAATHAIKTYLPKVDPKAWRKVRRAEVGSATWAYWARAMLIHQYARREVWHLQSTSDVTREFSSCAWGLQGRSRLERFRHLERAWARVNPDPGSRVRFIAVDGIAPHSSKAIFASEAGRQALFY